MASSGGSDDEPFDLFNEPADYYPPEKPHKFVEYTLKNGQTLSLRLLGHSPLWVC
jgi:EEF1A N-terminal glycine/lysine methyltransferase